MQLSSQPTGFTISLKHGFDELLLGHLSLKEKCKKYYFMSLKFILNWANTAPVHSHPFHLLAVPSNLFPSVPETTSFQPKMRLLSSKACQLPRSYKIAS